MTASPLQLVTLDAIDASDRLRPVDPDRVAALAASISEIGLEQPVLIRPAPEGNGFLLIAGAHRLAAMQELDETEIAAVVLDVDARTARIMEIDENLVRHELSALDFAIAVAERKALYEQQHPETVHGGARQGAGRNSSRKDDDLKKDDENQGQIDSLAAFMRFSADAASRTGLSERTFQNASALIDRLDPAVVPLVRQTALARNGSQLKRLSRLEPRHQITVAKSIMAGESRSISDALMKTDATPVTFKSADEQATQKFLDLLARSNARTRRVFAHHLFQHGKPGDAAGLAESLVELLPKARLDAIREALGTT